MPMPSRQHLLSTGRRTGGALAVLLALGLFGCVSTPEPEPQLLISFVATGEGISAADDARGQGPKLLCFPAGYFQLGGDENILREYADGIHIQSPGGMYVIHAGPFLSDPLADYGTAVHREMSGSIYRYESAIPIYVFTLNHPLQDVQFPFALMSGSALRGGPEDGTIFSRMGFLQPSAPCDREYEMDISAR